MQSKIPISIIKLNSNYLFEPLEDTSVITDSKIIQVIYKLIGND